MTLEPDDPHWEQNQADRIERSRIAMAINEAIPAGAKLTNILIVLGELTTTFAYQLGKPKGKPRKTRSDRT